MYNASGKCFDQYTCIFYNAINNCCSWLFLAPDRCSMQIRNQIQTEQINDIAEKIIEYMQRELSCNYMYVQ